MPYAATDAIDASLVQVAVTGAVYVAPTGSTVPVAATGILDAAFKNVGYISEDGVVESNETDTNDITAWQNSDIVRKTITRSEVSYQFMMMETNASALSLFYGKNVAGSATSHTIGGLSYSRVALVIDILDNGSVIRRVIPNAEVTERGDVTLSNGEAMGYQITVTAYPDSALGASAVAYYETPLVDGQGDPST